MRSADQAYPHVPDETSSSCSSSASSSSEDLLLGEFLSGRQKDAPS